MPIAESIGQEQMDVTATASGLTTAAMQGVFPACAEMKVEEAAVRYTTNGTTATPDVGKLASPGDTIELKSRGEVNLFSAIRDGAENAKLSILFGIQWVP